MTPQFIKVLTNAAPIWLAATIVSCGSVNKKMESWVGYHKSELYQHWGPPSRITEDGQGGEILIYESFVNTGQTPGQISPSNNGTYRYTSPQQNGYNRTRMFYVNSEGTIYGWRWQGL